MKSAALPLAALAALVPHVAAQAAAYGQCQLSGVMNFGVVLISMQAAVPASPARLAVRAATAASSSMRVSLICQSVRTLLTHIDRPGYSQCLTGGAANPSAALPFLGGVNTAGYDFTVATDGSFSGTGVSPPTAQYQHFASEGVNVFRIPFAWQLMTPTVGGTVSSTFLSKYDSTVDAALAAPGRPYVIVDLHSACPRAPAHVIAC
jgi:hypothetical protein